MSFSLSYVMEIKSGQISNIFKNKIRLNTLLRWAIVVKLIASTISLRKRKFDLLAHKFLKAIWQFKIMVVTVNLVHPHCKPVCPEFDTFHTKLLVLEIMRDVANNTKYSNATKSNILCGECKGNTKHNRGKGFSLWTSLSRANYLGHTIVGFESANVNKLKRERKK